MKNNKDATLKEWGELLDKMGLNDVSTTKINIARMLESDASKLITNETPFDTHGVPLHLHGPKKDDTVGTKKNEINKNKDE